MTREPVGLFETNTRPPLPDDVYVGRAPVVIASLGVGGPYVSDQDLFNVWTEIGTEKWVPVSRWGRTARFLYNNRDRFEDRIRDGRNEFRLKEVKP